MKRAALFGLTLLAACKTEAGVETDASPRDTPQVEASNEERRDLHDKAFAALVPAAIEAMTLADPVAAAQLGLAALRPPPATLAEREALRSACERAVREAEDIDASLLEPNKQIGLRTIRFVLDRVNDQLSRHLPIRNDPTVMIAELSRVVDELEYVALRGDCHECGEVIVAMVGTLDASHRELTAASEAGLAGAIEDLDRLRPRLEGFGSRTQDPTALEPAIDAALTGLDRTRAAFIGAREQLPAASPHAWIDRPPPRGASPALARLPDRLGARPLLRRLEVEEALSTSIEGLLGSTKRNLARYDAMHQELVGPATAKDRPRPVDEARCQAVWQQLTQTALAQPGFEDAEIDCRALVRHAAGEKLDDADLLIRITDHGVIEPVRRAFRRSQDPSIALATGRWAADAQRTLRRVMVLAPTGDRVALGRAIDSGRRDLCRAATALWIHGELGDDDSLDAWLRGACPSAPPSAWIHEALSRPRAALVGLGLASISAEPASMVGIDRFYWAPLGLIPLLATPPGSAPPSRNEDGRPIGTPPIEIKVEELGQ